ncbi:hypothetical protein Jab_2c13510 [Janthinobacterium sp. HH01]|uniref:PEP-CTERM sorting domain-containing protein n=1 Tax=Janthinobacterium sp. HH01 TaxID=1198452 RepID=UPI0002AECE8B|nr:PEP-CTERM sorting domain-containing protein [Janthinobacterium sp. HH01]ELX09286.1 hypothetical protein Jab_2c13510 [Janthinobacterium sp. HH01]
MRRIASVLIGLFCAASAHAEIVTFDYTGVIKNLRDYPHEGGSGVVVASSTIIPGGVRVGDVFHGSYTIDTGVPLEFTDAQSAHYTAPWQTTPPVVKPATVVFDKTGATAVFRSQAPDVYIQRSSSETVYLHMVSDNFQFLNIQFFNETPGTLPDFSIPNKFDLNAWSHADAYLTWFVPYVGSVFVESSLTSITKVSAVPEPESYAMLLAGLALVSTVAARRKQQRG